MNFNKNDNKRYPQDVGIIKDFKAAIITKLQEVKIEKCKMNGKVEVLSREISEVKVLLKNKLNLHRLTCIMEITEEIISKYVGKSK